jgi:mycofactocin precursor
MTTRAASTAPETPAATDDVVVAEDDGLIEEDLLVEDVSIDGMCGVY